MIRCTHATDRDDATLRSLLRDNAMPSWVSMCMTREPSFFAGCNRFGQDWAVIARKDDAIVGMYACTLHPVYLNGKATEAGYLGALRVAPSYRHRIRMLREGYASVLSLSPRRNLQQWYTSIASENYPARRLLEAGLPGMPHYQPINEMVTMALSTARGRRRSLWREIRPDELDRLCDFYNRQARQFQFSPQLTPENAITCGANFFIIEHEGEIRGCMALWNQQAYKQVRALAYRSPLQALRPLYNVYARLCRRVCLPPPGTPLDQTYLAFLALEPGQESRLSDFIEDALAITSGRVLTLGLHSGHPWLEPLTRRFKPALYRTCIYTVNFEKPIPLDERPAQPEVALL